MGAKTKQHRVHILTAVNAAQVSKAGGVYTIKDVCGAVDNIVMNGRLYPGDQLAASAPTLEGKPAPAGHPRNAEGHYISAVNGDALLSSYIGSVCKNARHEGGRLLCNVVVNEAQANAHDAGKRLLQRLDAAIAGTDTAPIHVSTGVFCEEVKASGESGGKAYTSIAVNLRFDHLAVLLDEPGAGTPEEGVGMFLANSGQPEPVEVALLISNATDTTKAEKSLRDAIELHQAHMDGKEPTTGPEGDKSQMKMMKMMKAALAALVGKGDKGGKGMAMNVATVPADLRHEGAAGWLRKLLGNASDLSFDQISSLLRKALPEDGWPIEIYAKHLVWVDQQNRLWRQDYAVASEGASVTFTSEPTEVVRRVDYQPVTNQEKDEVKEHILAALNAAGVSTEGKTDAQLLDAYNSLARKPVEDKLTAANEKIAGFEQAAAAAETKKRDELVTKLATNAAGLTADELKVLPLAALERMAGATQAAAPILTGNSGGKGASEFAGYDFNAINGIKE